MPLLKTEFKDQILTIILADKKTRNAFSPAMSTELFSVLQNSKIKGVIVSHESSYFCSGGNLKFYKSLETKEEGLEVNRGISKILAFLSDLPIPKACFVDGVCLGGGVELLSCFDFVVASPQSLFGLWQRRVGLTFGWGGGERLARRIPQKKLTHWLLSAETKNVYSALELGLVDQVSLANQGLADCRHWVQRCLDLGPESIGCILDPKIQESAGFSNLWLGEAHMEALGKFK